ncbi:MAG: EAL domain-containing protein [Spirulina sp. SIO3F2]|nr:EAL domain-containing protein [Spirulina sp. SIO3F2]
MDESFTAAALDYSAACHTVHRPSPFQSGQPRTAVASDWSPVWLMKPPLTSVQLLTLQQQILEMIATDQNLDTILCAVLQGITTAIADIEAVIYPVDCQRQCLAPGISYGYSAKWLHHLCNTPLSSVAQELLEHASPPITHSAEFMLINPSEIVSDRALEQSGLTHTWGTSILDSQGKTTGVLLLGSAATRILNPAEQNLLEVATHLASIAIEQKQARVATQQAQAQYRDIVEHLSIGIFQTTPAGQYLSANPALAQLYGYDSPAELVAALTDIGDQLYVDPSRRIELIALMQSQGRVASFESQVYCRDGQMIWISETMRSVCNEQGQLLYYEGTVEDVTARHIAEERLLHGALHDSLTELPNRACFLDRVQQAIATPNTYAVLFIDLDRFKVINDSLGHLVGDQLLQAVARRLRSCLAPMHLFARLGGDEFALLLTEIQSVQSAMTIAEQLLNQLQQPFQLHQYEVFVEASIGIAWGRDCYTTPEAVLRDADIAMYRAKNSRCQYRYQVFDPQMQVQAHQRLQLEHDLRYSIERQELSLVYQPLINLKNGRLQGFEALLRWHHPKRGAIPPDVFIPIAEETGQIHAIGIWLFEQACQQLQQWSDSSVYLNVNLSLLQIREKAFLPRLQNLCVSHQIQPHRLKLELTESCLLGGDAVHHSQLNTLKEMGFSLCVDDFGTGYSSLSRLHTLPIDALKIDRTFVQDLSTQEHAVPFIKTMVALAQSLSLELVAEGVETAKQAEILQMLGCHTAQGYFWAKPLDAATASQWVAKQMR